MFSHLLSFVTLPREPAAPEDHMQLNIGSPVISVAVGGNDPTRVVGRELAAPAL